MGSDSSIRGQGPHTEGQRAGSISRQVESPAASPPPSSSSSFSASPSSNIPLEIELDLERLRAERDALAAELQIERAERLRAEERLRMFEREKLEQMRDGAASRERLASELEESRLRAMRAEARQAVLEAEMRLSEIAARRGGVWPEPTSQPVADEVAEPTDDDTPTMADEPDSEAAPEPAPRRLGGALRPPGTNVSKYSRLRAGTAPAGGAASRPAGTGADSNRSGEAKDGGGGPGSRQRPAGPGESRSPSSRQAPPQREAAGSASRFASSARPGSSGTGAFGAGDRAGSPSRGGAQPGARGGDSRSAKGGAAAGRPSIDRAQLETRLSAGQTLETTERFRQFEPVAQGHIKICDWLKQAKTLDDIEALAAGELARSEIIAVLTLFFERSFLVFKAE